MARRYEAKSFGSVTIPLIALNKYIIIQYSRDQAVKKGDGTSNHVS